MAHSPGETTQQLKMLLLFQMTRVQLPVHLQLATVCDSSSRGSVTLFWLHMCCAHVFTCACTHTHIHD